MIMAITGRRGRPPNPDKEKPRRVRGLKGGQARRPGRPPKPKMIDLLSKVDAKLLKRLEAKGEWMLSCGCIVMHFIWFLAQQWCSKMARCG